TDLSDDELAAAFADNPLGQERQQTPLAVVVRGPRLPVPAAASDRRDQADRLPLNPPYDEARGAGRHDVREAQPSRSKDAS
ncbi:MAG TPA: hypothetical protein VE172_16585, partial [Stackebrandtia sp.]|uniref:hypothetical protein n=1 Tax=Stackebrandtia sp. TaxID=2023065 RepID=UPI002D657ECF